MLPDRRAGNQGSEPFVGQELLRGVGRTAAPLTTKD